MIDRYFRRSAAAAISIAVISVAAASASAWASIPDANGVIHACYNRFDGITRVIDTGSQTPAEVHPVLRDSAELECEGSRRAAAASPVPPVPLARPVPWAPRGIRVPAVHRVRPAKPVKPVLRVWPEPRGQPGRKGLSRRAQPRLVTRDELATVSSTENTTVDSFCNSGETAVGGAVNSIPDGTPGVVTSRPDGDTLGDSPENGEPFIGWRGVATPAGAGSLLVVHVFCAS